MVSVSQRGSFWSVETTGVFLRENILIPLDELAVQNKPSSVAFLAFDQACLQSRPLLQLRVNNEM